MVKVKIDEKDIIRTYTSSSGNTIRICNSYIKGKTVQQCIDEANRSSSTWEIRLKDK